MSLRRLTAQGQELARSIIDQLVFSQGSSVCEALKKATKVFDERRHKNTVASIILLSDGQDDSVQANHNNKDKNTNHRRESPLVSSTRFGSRRNSCTFIWVLSRACHGCLLEMR
ncbi:Zinc finger (C3HC4-type RING finger) family protein [Forsythia ovata]|uniref:Zinc finger (C3HC4-type RING finger) family protein n=1 Tax=Forsythia ovata TaxID=205694 RepID=A0ABD1VJD5_9LAMI